jgi:hypothetical protein
MARAEEHRWAVDGIEEGMARIEEDGDRTITVPSYLLPGDVKEGQLLRVTSSGGKGKSPLVVTVEIDEAGTAAALAASRKQVRDAMETSRRRDPGGDVSL